MNNHSNILNESKLDKFVQPKNNIVCVQCLFRDLLTSTRLNAVSLIVSPSLRRGLDFELYWHVDGSTMKELLSSRLLVTNCKDASPLVGDKQIVDILAKHEPFAGFLTDAQGDTITGEVLSPKSENILRRRSAQNENFSVFRFSFISAGYDVAWTKLLASRDTGYVFEPGKLVQVWKNKKIFGLKDDSTGAIIPAKEIVELNPFLISGYWNKIKFDAKENEFVVEQGSSIPPFIPALTQGGSTFGSLSKMFYEVVKTVDDVDNSKLIGFLEKAVSVAMQSGSDLRTRASSGNVLNESPYDKELRDLRSQTKKADTAPRSKIGNGPWVDVEKEAWKSAQEVAKSVGAAKIFKSKVHFETQWSGSDYVDGYTKDYTICFYASSLESAKDMLATFKKERDYHGRSALDLSNYPNYSEYTFSEPVEVTKAEADAVVAENKGKAEGMTDHILYLPTRAIMDEMKASINWALNMVKKLRDQDDAKKREAWLQTPEGKAWKDLYDKEQEILKKVSSWEARKQERDEIKRKKDEQRELDAAEVQKCFNGKSTDNPAYNMPFVPVEVSGGRKFQGKGFVVGIEERDSSFGDDFWMDAKIYSPYSTPKFSSTNLKYCKLDTSISPEDCKKMQDSYYYDKAQSTLEWCRKRDPSKSDVELQRWAAMVCKKYIPGMDVTKYFSIGDLDEERAKSTAKWACGLSDVKTAADAERIITKALAKKGLDAMKYKDAIASIVILKFGKTEKFA